MFLQQPFPDRYYLYRIAICLYLRLVVTGDDVTVIAWKGLSIQKYFKVYFAKIRKYI